MGRHRAHPTDPRITLNLKTRRGQEIIHRLVERADVLVEN